MMTLKLYTVEQAPTYIAKTVLTFILASIPFLDAVDAWMKIVAAIIAAITAFYTIRRIIVDTEYRREELKEKRLNNKRLEEQIKKKYEAK